MTFGALPQYARRRVVVTGVGMVNSLGVNVETSWKQLLAGAVGIRSIGDFKHFFPSSMAKCAFSGAANLTERHEQLLATLPCQVAGSIITEGKDPFEATSRESRAQRIALHAAKEAFDQAFSTTSLKEIYPSERVGVSVGVGMAGVQEMTDAACLLCASNPPRYNHISPFFVPSVLPNIVAGSIAMKYGLQGPLSAASTACATGAHCIGQAFQWVSAGVTDAALCGATEACITPVGIGGFCRMKALCTAFNDRPQEASRPFDKARKGFVMGEGAGILVLETLDKALARGAPILAEVRGFGSSSDAYHVSSPHPKGRGAEQCILAALRDAGLLNSQETGPAFPVAYVNAHATGTPMGDEIELETLSRVLKHTTRPVPVSSTKGAIGHLLGAAGSVEAIISVLALRDGQAPPTVNLVDPLDPVEGIELITKAKALSSDANIVISTSFGFGGINAALVFTRA